MLRIVMDQSRFASQHVSVTSPPAGLADAFPSVWVTIAVPLTYFVAAVCAIYLGGQAGNISSLWPAGAILLAALLRNRPSTWPILLLLGCAADFGANLFMGSTPKAAIGVAFVDALEALLVAVALHRLAGAEPWFTSTRWMAVFGISSVLASVVVAFLGSSWLATLGEAPFAASWKLWTVADALGLIIVTPFLLSWTEPVLRRLHGSRTLVEAIGLACVVAAVAFLIFTNAKLPFLFLVFPFLLLITFRAGLPGATIGTATLALIASWFTLRGLGPIASNRASIRSATSRSCSSIY